MGEYAKYRGDEIKIGTCESMYYLRFEDRHLVEWIRGNVDPANDMGLFWRLPFPDEDGRGPGSYTDYCRGTELRKGNEYFRCDNLADDAGNIQLTHQCGYLVNMPCHHGEHLPDLGDKVRTFWNGKAGSFYELRHVKNTAEGVKPVIACRFCGNLWRMEWADVLEWIPCRDLRSRLAVHAANPAAVA